MPPVRNAAGMTPAVQPGNPLGVLFRDDFSSFSGGWKQVETPQGSLTYLNGGYQITVNQPYAQIWSTPRLEFKDTRVEVLAYKTGGQDDNIFGIICRKQDTRQFYALVISSDGYYGIARVQDTSFQFLGKEAMQPGEAIGQGAVVNRLRADCVGNVLRLFANGEMLTEVQDAAYSAGEVGLIAGAQGSPGTVILFDDFQVFKP